MRVNISESEPNDRKELNFKRLKDDKYYMIDEVFSPADYEVFDDKRALGHIKNITDNLYLPLTGKSIHTLLTARRQRWVM